MSLDCSFSGNLVYSSVHLIIVPVFPSWSAGSATSCSATGTLACGTDANSLYGCFMYLSTKDFVPCHNTGCVYRSWCRLCRHCLLPFLLQTMFALPATDCVFRSWYWLHFQCLLPINCITPAADCFYSACFLPTVFTGRELVLAWQ